MPSPGRAQVLAIALVAGEQLVAAVARVGHDLDTGVVEHGLHGLDQALRRVRHLAVERSGGHHVGARALHQIAGVLHEGDIGVVAGSGPERLEDLLTEAVDGRDGRGVEVDDGSSQPLTPLRTTSRQPGASVVTRAFARTCPARLLARVWSYSAQPATSRPRSSTTPQERRWQRLPRWSQMFVPSMATRRQLQSASANLSPSVRSPQESTRSCSTAAATVTTGESLQSRMRLAKPDSRSNPTST